MENIVVLHMTEPELLEALFLHAKQLLNHVAVIAAMLILGNHVVKTALSRLK